MLRSLIGLAAALAATTAFAQSQKPTPLGVWDATGAFVGTLFEQGVVEITINDTPVLFDFDPGGNFFSGQNTLVFTSNNCSGTPYVSANGLPARAVIAGGSFFYPTKVTQVQVSSGLTNPGLSSSFCSSGSPTPTYAGVAAQAALPKVTPPLCVSATHVRCQ